MHGGGLPGRSILNRCDEALLPLGDRFSFASVSESSSSATVVSRARVRGVSPDRTSADDEHTNVVIMLLICTNADSPRWGRVTTRAAQPGCTAGVPTDLADQ